MYGCESWTIKKAERRRIDAFELWCLRRLLRVPWTARRSNQSILKEISPGCSLEGLMLKLKLQYFGHLMRRADSERLKAGGQGDDRGWDGWMASLTQCTWVWVDSGSWWWTGRPGMLRFIGLQRVRHDWATQLNWTNLSKSVHTNQPNRTFGCFTTPPTLALLPASVQVFPMLWILVYHHSWPNLSFQKPNSNDCSPKEPLLVLPRSCTHPFLGTGVLLAFAARVACSKLSDSWGQWSSPPPSMFILSLLFSS